MKDPVVIGVLVLAVAAWFFWSIVSGARAEIKRRENEEIAQQSARLSKAILREEREKARLREKM